MGYIIERDLGFRGDVEALKKRLKIDEEFEEEFLEVYAECEKVARPVYALIDSRVEYIGGDVVIDGVAFHSDLLKKNLGGRARVFPHIVSCGRELYELALSTDDPLARYWVDCYSEQALFCASRASKQRAIELSGETELYNMGPGSLKEFPITAQKPMFSLFGDTKKAFGVELTETCLILPYKSGSGIYFASEEGFVSCSMCPRENCPNRRAPYNEMMSVMS